MFLHFAKLVRDKCMSNKIEPIFQDISHKNISALIVADSSLDKINEMIKGNNFDVSEALLEIRSMKSSINFLLDYSRMMSRSISGYPNGDLEELYLKESLNRIFFYYPVRDEWDLAISRKKANVLNFKFKMSFSDFSYTIKKILYVIHCLAEKSQNNIDFSSEDNKALKIVTLIRLKRVNSVFKVKFPSKGKETIFFGLSDVRSILSQYNHALNVYKNEAGNLVFKIIFGVKK